MTDPIELTSVNCQRFKRDLYHFQAGELPEAERQAFDRHLEACSDCARRIEVEAALLRGLKRRLVRTPAPAGLAARVRQSLDGAAAGGRFRAWLRAPWLVPAAAALILAVVLVPGLTGPAGVFPVERQVTLVDLDCDRNGLPTAQQPGCTHPHHLNALKVGPDEYWTIGLDREVGRRLVTDRQMRGRQLRVVGDFYEEIRTLHVTSFEDVGGNTNVSSNHL